MVLVLRLGAFLTAAMLCVPSQPGSAASPADKRKPGLYMTFQTDKGNIECKLYEVEAPVTVRTMVGLAIGKMAWMHPETRQVMKNLTNILETAGTSLGNVVKTTIYLKDMSDFDEVNKTYGEFFPDHKPARATVEVARLPKDVKIEVDAIAVCPN